ncbi:hypothetical protein Pint_20331 [Pistacia integerrima]|uniref:Uncharacterized protein n=1 Tax=Pistacia integerrima TaxID=434235 RepID=A0ACC0XC63_9ROSI|nr:hypothetical protein Pint_20331 [Pistacia integerrima]
MALLAAWKAACKVPGATLEIPSEFKFLIKPITLQGPCMPHLVLQIDGTLLAPPEAGTGTVDGQGPQWWTASSLCHTPKKLKHIPDLKPTALRFY